MVEGLRNGDARALLGSVLRVPLDERVRERIVAETRGNPLALLELPRGLTPAELAGGFGLPDAPALSGGSRTASGGGWRRLPAETRRLLLVAAAEPVGDPVLVWRAAGRLGIGAEAATRRDRRVARDRRAGDVSSPAGPLGGLSGGVAGGRQEVHRALADATDPEVDPDRRAWHLAQATPGLDEDVAAELERSAGRAQAPRRVGGRGRVPGARRRADARARAPSRARAGRGTGQARRPARSTRRSDCWRSQSPGRWTNSSAPRSTCCAGRSRSRRAAAATRHRCCSRPPSGSSHSIEARARDLSGRAPGRVLPRPSGERRGCAGDRAGRQGSASCVAASARARSAAGWPGAADHRWIRRRGADAETGADGFRDEETLPRRGRRWLWLAARRRGICGTTRPGTCCPRASSSSRVMPVR